jgi:hypothetical protein
METERDFIKIYSDNNSSYIVAYVDEDNVTWIEKYYIDETATNEDEYKYTLEEFSDMMIRCFSEAKKKGSEIYRQCITRHEYESIDFLKNDDRWDYIEKNEHYCVMECDIDDAAKCVIEAFMNKSLLEE